MDHNYVNTFISVAEDTKATASKEPAPRGASRTVAQYQYELLREPFRHTQEDVLFEVWMARQGDAGNLAVDELAPDEIAQLRSDFFAKGQPCLRASPLTKSHGWGVHFDAEGRAALVAMESDEYRRCQQDGDLTQLKAMRTKRA